MPAEFTKFQKSKLIHMFTLLDLDGSGTLEYQDFRMSVDMLALKRGLDTSSEHYLRLVEDNKKLWRMLSKPLDFDSDGTISQSEWLAFHIKAFVLNPQENGVDPDFSSAMNATAKFFCDLLDLDGDGFITVEDYVQFCEAYNVGANEAMIGFSMFDRDGNGQLSQEEVFQMVREFYLSEDPDAPGNLFFGSF